MFSCFPIFRPQPTSCLIVWLGSTDWKWIATRCGVPSCLSGRFLSIFFYPRFGASISFLMVAKSRPFSSPFLDVELLLPYLMGSNPAEHAHITSQIRTDGSFGLATGALRKRCLRLFRSDSMICKNFYVRRAQYSCS